MEQDRKIKVGDMLYGLSESCGTYCESDVSGDWYVLVVGHDYVVARFLDKRFIDHVGVWNAPYDKTIHEYLVPYLTKKGPMAKELVLELYKSMHDNADKLLSGNLEMLAGP